MVVRRKVFREDGSLDIDASMKAFEEQPDAGILEDLVRAAEDGEIVTFHIPDDSPLAKLLEG